MASKKVLLVMAEDMQREFGELVSLEGIECVGVTTCDEARGVLAGNEEVSMIVTDETLPDGSWYCLLQEMVSQGKDLDLSVVVPKGSEATSIKSCGVDVVEYPLDAAARRRLVGSGREAANSATVA